MGMYSRRLFFIIGLLPLFLLGLLSCEGRRDVRDYYFPVRQLTGSDGKVYAYLRTGSQPGPDTAYWYYLGVDLDTALYLTTTGYGPDLSPRQLSREKITNEGSRLQELTAFATDSAGRSVPTEMEVLYEHTFPFYLDGPGGGPYGYRLRGQFAGSAAMTYVTLDRTEFRDTSTFILGEERPGLCVRLFGEVSERDPELGDISPTFSGYEIYTRGLGLTEYYRNLGAGGTFGGRLVRTLPMTEFARPQ